MNTAVKTQGKNGTEHQEILKVKEEWAMKATMWMTKVNMRLHETLAAKTPVKLLGGLALGALLMAATALPLGTASADEPAKPLSGEQIVQCYPEIDENACTSDQLKVWLGIDPSSEDQTHFIERYEAEEMLFDELAESFIGVPAPASSHITEAPQELDYLVSQYYNVQEMEFDELGKAFIGVPVSSSSETTQALVASDYWVQRAETEEMAFDEARQALIGKLVSSEQMKVFASVAELESLYPDTPYYRDPDWREHQIDMTSLDSLVPDTPYYRDPDWREGQMPDTRYYSDSDYRDSEPGKGKVGSPSPVGIEAWGDLKPALGSLDYLVHLGYDVDEDELDPPTLQLLLETANKQGTPQQVGAHD